MLKFKNFGKTVISLLLIISLSIPQISFAEDSLKSAYFLPPISVQPRTMPNAKTIYENEFDDLLSDIIELEISSLSDSSKTVMIDSFNVKNGMYVYLFKDFKIEKNESVKFSLYIKGDEEQDMPRMLIAEEVYTPTEMISTIPVKFVVFKDLNIRVRQLHLQGKSAEEISSNLIEEFGTTAEETATALKEDGFSAVDINWALKNVFELEYAVAAPILKLVGFDAPVIANALQQVNELGVFVAINAIEGLYSDFEFAAAAVKIGYNISSMELALILKEQDIAASVITNILAGELGEAGLDTIGILLRVGFNEDVIAAAVDGVYVLGYMELSNKIGDLGYKLEVVVKLTKLVCTVSNNDLFKYLDQKYGVGDVAEAMHDYANMSYDAIGSVIEDLDYGAETCANTLRDIGCDKDKVMEILDDNNYGYDALLSVLQDVYDYSYVDAVSYLADVLGF